MVEIASDTTCVQTHPDTLPAQVRWWQGQTTTGLGTTGWDWRGEHGGKSSHWILAPIFQPAIPTSSP